MENFNRVISFALGLVIVVVFLAIISGKIDLRKRIPLLGQGTTAKVSVTPTPSTTAGSPTPTGYTNYQQQSQTSTNNIKSTPKTIPATGAPTIVLPILFSSLLAGVYLHKKS